MTKQTITRRVSLTNQDGYSLATRVNNELTSMLAAATLPVTDIDLFPSPDNQSVFLTLLESDEASTTVSIAAEHVDGSAFTADTDKGVAILGVYDDTAIDSGDYGVLRLTEDRNLVIAGYNELTEAVRVEEVDPLSSHTTYTKLVEENITTNTTSYHYIPMDGRRYVGIQAITDGTTPADTLTMTIEATMQNDGTALASCDWYDITETLTGETSFVDEDWQVEVDTPLPVYAIRVKYVTSNDSGNDCDFTLNIRSMY